MVIVAMMAVIIMRIMHGHDNLKLMNSGHQFKIVTIAKLAESVTLSSTNSARPDTSPRNLDDDDDDDDGDDDYRW